MISHALIGDFLIGGGLQLLWPFSTAQYGLHELGLYYIGITDPVNIALELSLFAIATLVLYKSGDWRVLFKSNKSNLVLIIPLTTVLLPSTIGYPFSAPLLSDRATFSDSAPFLPFALQHCCLKNAILHVQNTHSTFHLKYENKVLSSNLVTDKSLSSTLTSIAAS